MDGDISENYYDILDIPKSASLDDIRKAYKKMAKLYHPDKNKNAGAKEKFTMATKAHEVLSDPLARSWYDKGRNADFDCGSQWPPSGLDRETFQRYFQRKGCPNIFDEDNDHFDMTHEKFTTNSSMSDSKRFREQTRQSSSTSNCEFTNSGTSARAGKRSFPDDFGGRSNYTNCGPAPKRSSQHQPSSTTSGSTSAPLHKDPTIEKPLEISLDELYTGCTKKLKIKRTINDIQPSLSRQEEIVVPVEVKPGWKAGTKVTYEEHGDKYPGRIAGDITFVIKDKPHALFTRDSDNNLLYKASISLKTALLGVSHCIQGLNGARHTINIPDIIHPGFVKRYPGKGLPLPKNPTQRGDLIVAFDIEFPNRLSWDQRRILTECLPD